MTGSAGASTALLWITPAGSDRDTRERSSPTGPDSYPTTPTKRTAKHKLNDLPPLERTVDRFATPRGAHHTQSEGRLGCGAAAAAAFGTLWNVLAPQG